VLFGKVKKWFVRILCDVKIDFREDEFGSVIDEQGEREAMAI
jgi:hypothetical protein